MPGSQPNEAIWHSFIIALGPKSQPAGAIGNIVAIDN
jgi:hypothetical protein